MVMQLIQLNNEDTLQHWPTISSLLQKAKDKGQGESSMSDYMKKILNGYAQCWVAIDDERKIIGAGLTEFMVYSKYKTLHIILFTGVDFEQQSKLFYTVEAFAKEAGCVAVEQWGRPGWAKVLPKYVPGFKQAYVVMRKEIGDDTNEVH
jgi:hypothetical protein